MRFHEEKNQNKKDLDDVEIIDRLSDDSFHTQEQDVNRDGALWEQSVLNE